MWSCDAEGIVSGEESWPLLLTSGHWIDIDIAVTGKWSEGATPAVPWNVLLKIDSSLAGGFELGQQDPLNLCHP